MTPEANQTADDGGGIVLLELLEVVRRRWVLHVVGAVVGVALGVLWLGTKDPSYRAEATLLLDQEGASAGVLGDLAALTQAPIAISEMEILRSRSVASEVARDPAGGLAALASGARDASTAAADADALALRTVVDDVSLRPLEKIKRRLRGEPRSPRGAETLRAIGALPDGDLGPLELIVRFPSNDRVEVGLLGVLGASDVESFDLAAGAAIEYRGARLSLLPQGDPTGRTYRITLLSEADAIERIMDATSVQETDRNSGVIRITYGDTDPGRAAETVNALCRRYLARNEESTQRRASRTVGYIEESLETQVAALREAEESVVTLKAESPELLDIGETAKALIEELSALEVRRVEGGIVRAGLEEATALLEDGDLAALSRLGAEVADPIVLGYVESIVKLNAEAEVLERTDTGAYKALLQGHVLELEAQRDALSLRLGTLEEIHGRLEAGDLSVLGRLESAATAGTADPMLTALIEQWTGVDAELRKLEVEFTDELPGIQTLRAERDGIVARIAEIVGGRVAGLEGQLAEYDVLCAEREDGLASLPGVERDRITAAVERLSARALSHLRARLAGLEADDARLSEQADALTARLAELPEHERTLAAPMRAVVTHGEIVKLLMMRQQEAEITKAASLASAEFIDAAVPPRRPRGPSLPMHVALGMMLGLGCAAGWALLRESQASGVFTAAELERASGLPVVGTIPAFKKPRGQGTFVPLRDEPAGAAAEAFRALRSNLKFLIRSKGDGTTIAVTSSGPGEGKSMVNIDVGLSFAATGKRVLLVDCDMRRNSVSEYLGLSPATGLAEALKGETDWRDGLVASPHESMVVLPAGAVPASPGDLLAGPRAAEIIDEMRTEYDLIVLDVPPVLAVADIECVATHLDTVLLLCRSGKTDDAQVRHAITRLRQVGANVVATVLNGVRARRGDYGYGYGYGYGNDSGKGRGAA